MSGWIDALLVGVMRTIIPSHPQVTNRLPSIFRGVEVCGAGDWTAPSPDCTSSRHLVRPDGRGRGEGVDRGGVCPSDGGQGGHEALDGFRGGETVGRIDALGREDVGQMGG